MPFDARAAKLLQPGRHLTIAECPGLRLEASATRRSWIYRYRSRVDGRLRQLKLGEWPATTFAAAAGEWERQRSALASGDDPAAAKREARRAAIEAARRAAAEKKAAAYTVRRVCDEYLAGHVAAARKEKGAAEVARMLATMLGDLAERPVATITRADAFGLLERHRATPVQASKLRAELGAAWDYALDAGRLDPAVPNWWRQVMRGRLRSTGKRIAGESTGPAKRHLSEAELGELLRWLPNFPRTVADALTLYLWTLARGSEILAIDAAEISREADGVWWTVPKTKTKSARHENATDFRVPLVGRALQVVERRLALHPTGPLFPSTGRAGHVEQKAIQTAVHYHQPYSRTRPKLPRPRLTVTHWAPHDLRRTGRTMLAALECPDDVAEAMLGHMQAGVRGIYNRHGYDRQRRQWLERLSGRLEALAAAPLAPAGARRRR